jgi:hypothetical protein
MKKLRPLPSFAKGDGAHCGLTDWYPKQERALKRALKKGKPFTTGWYSSKKEIASAMINRTDRSVEVHVSVSDDFDTEGHWAGSIKPTTDLEKIRELIFKIWDKAGEAQKANRAYRGFAVYRNKRIYSLYMGGEPVGKSHIRPACVTYLILPWGDAITYNFATPPGDNYHAWGFQDGGIPKTVQTKLREWAEDYLWAKDQSVKEFTVGKFTIKPWEGD